MITNNTTPLIIHANVHENFEMYEYFPMNKSLATHLYRMTPELIVEWACDIIHEKNCESFSIYDPSSF